MANNGYKIKYHKFLLKNNSNSSRDFNASDIAVKARTDVGMFGEYVCGKKPASHHESWIDELCGESNDLLTGIAGENTSILSPRGSAKSTWIAYIVAWVIGNNPGIQIIYESYSEPIAVSRSRIIKKIIESKRYQEVFPHIRKSSKWADTMWEIDKTYAGVPEFDSDYTLFATGITGSIVSRRSHLIILDDLIKSSQSINNREIRMQIITNFHETILPTLVPGGRCISIGTRFRRDDIHATEFISEKGWRVIEQKAILSEPRGGKEYSYWEERFSLKFLQEIREKDPIIFSYQYQNTVINTGIESISYDWIYRGDIPFAFDRLIVGCDLASSLKSRADYTCFVLGGKIDNRYYIIDVRYGKWVGNVEKFETIKKLREEWGRFDLLVEKVAYQTSFKGDFDMWVGDNDLEDVYCQGVYLPGDKLQRLSGFKALFERGKIVFNQYRMMGRLLDEICNLGNSEHDDGADAFTLCMSGLTGRRRLDAGDVE